MFVVPKIAGSNPALEQQMSSLHAFATWSMLALVALHAAAALKHHLVDRDAALRQMVPRWSPGR
jgi:cytochrome b561